MIKIYVTSSWRNELQPEVVKALRAEGYEVYDYKNPRPGDNGFHWSEIDPDWKEWMPASFIKGLQDPIAESGFSSDMNALAQCDICVLVLPCNRSAHLEAGWAAGAGKKVFILIPEKIEPELMYKMTDGQVETIDQLIGVIKRVRLGPDLITRADVFRKTFALACRLISDGHCPDVVMGVDWSECEGCSGFGPNSWNCWQKYFKERVDAEQVCRVCGCTQDNACSGGCSWVKPDLCSCCADRGE
jgi:nucleoside 2-deoxyribosyltransferase